MGVRRWVALVAVVWCVATAPALAQEEGAVVGQPDLLLYVDDAAVEPGNETTLDVYIANGGSVTTSGPERFEERVTTARNVRFRVATERLNATLADALTVRRDATLAGLVPPGVAGPFPIDLSVSERLPPGAYALPVEVTYDYTALASFSPFDSPRYVDRTRTELQYLILTVSETARFRVRALPNQNVTAGSTATYQIAVTNAGTEPAADLGIRLSTDNATVFFGPTYERTGDVSLYVPRLAPGETRVLNVTVGASQYAASGTYLLEARVTYDDPLGVTRVSDRLALGVEVENG